MSVDSAGMKPQVVLFANTDDTLSADRKLAMSDSWTNRSFESDLFNEIAKSVRKTELKNSLIDQTVWEFLVLNESRVIRNDQRNNVSADSR